MRDIERQEDGKRERERDRDRERERQRQRERERERERERKGENASESKTTYLEDYLPSSNYNNDYSSDLHAKRHLITLSS